LASIGPGSAASVNLDRGFSEVVVEEPSHSVVKLLEVKELDLMATSAEQTRPEDRSLVDDSNRNSILVFVLWKIMDLATTMAPL
jgi:hypothetical protein